MRPVSVMMSAPRTAADSLDAMEGRIFPGVETASKCVTTFARPPHPWGGDEFCHSAIDCGEGTTGFGWCERYVGSTEHCPKKRSWTLVKRTAVPIPQG